MGHETWSVIVIAGLSAWIFTSIMLMLKAFPEKGAFDSSAGIRWGAASAVSFAVWIIGLLNA